MRSAKKPPSIVIQTPGVRAYASCHDLIHFLKHREFSGEDVSDTVLASRMISTTLHWLERRSSNRTKGVSNVVDAVRAGLEEYLNQSGVNGSTSKVRVIAENDHGLSIDDTIVLDTESTR